MVCVTTVDFDAGMEVSLEPADPSYFNCATPSPEGSHDLILPSGTPSRIDNDETVAHKLVSMFHPEMATALLTTVSLPQLP